jgi:hypothetical protein
MINLASNNIFNSTYNRENQTHTWCPCDTLENYLPTQPDFNNRLNYKITDFNYKFNSYGFRSDEFVDSADLSILFLGCSFTEGIGLPLEHTWTHQLLNHIKQIPKYQNKNIPFMSLALGGTGLDTAARNVLLHIDKIKPKYIFLLLPSVYRRDIILTRAGQYSIVYWTPNFDSIEARGIEKMLIDDRAVMQQTLQNLLAIDFAASKYNATVFLLQESPCNFVNDFGKMMPAIKICPPRLSLSHTSTYAELFSKHPPKGRDNAHPGITWHYEWAETVWDFVKLELNDK